MRLSFCEQRGDQRFAGKSLVSALFTEAEAHSMRRLPIYLLVDCSGSMSGDPIESVKQGIRVLHSTLMGDPSAVESAYLSVITFDSGARQLAPLTEIAQFNPPDLHANPVD